MLVSFFPSSFGVCKKKKKKEGQEPLCDDGVFVSWRAPCGVVWSGCLLMGREAKRHWRVLSSEVEVKVVAEGKAVFYEMKHKNKKEEGKKKCNGWQKGSQSSCALCCFFFVFVLVVLFGPLVFALVEDKAGGRRGRKNKE